MHGHIDHMENTFFINYFLDILEACLENHKCLESICFHLKYVHHRAAQYVTHIKVENGKSFSLRDHAKCEM